MRLGILEIGETDHKNDVQIIHDVLKYANLADKAGYSRFWLGEHHTSGSAWRSPLSLVTLIAITTKKISVGPGGVLLPLNNVLRIAQDYKLLGGLFPSRIDLGIARGITEPFIANLLCPFDIIKENEKIDIHSERIETLVNYIHDEIIHINQGDVLVLPPLNVCNITLWILGSSGRTMEIATKTKSAYSFSLIHSSNKQSNVNSEIFRNFREEYYLSNKTYPKTNLCLGIACSEDNYELEQIKLKYKESPLTISIMGSAKYCYDSLIQFSSEFQTDEIVLCFFTLNSRNKEYCYKVFSKFIRKYKYK